MAVLKPLGPTTLRPFCPSIRITLSSRYYTGTTTTTTTSSSPPTPDLSTSTTPDAILSTALRHHVPTTGFTTTSLRAALAFHSLSPAALNLFPRGPFELVLYHLRTARLGLSDRFSAGTPSATSPNDHQRSGGVTGAVRELTREEVAVRVRTLLRARLRANVSANVVGHWTEALALMSLAGNVPAALRELALLSDEVWYLAGDRGVEGGWYAKRAAVAAAYAAAELYQTQDRSEAFGDTDGFLDRRLEEARVLGGAVRDVREWAGFQGVAGVNLLRSLGARI